MDGQSLSLFLCGGPPIVFLIVNADRQNFLHMIARPSINKAIKSRKTMGGTLYHQGNYCRVTEPYNCIHPSTLKIIEGPRLL